MKYTSSFILTLILGGVVFVCGYLFAAGLQLLLTYFDPEDLWGFAIYIGAFGLLWLFVHTMVDVE